MSARDAPAGADREQPSRRRRWRKILGAFALFVIGLLLAAWYMLQPARLTALILDRASRMLQVELQTTGPGSYALRPEPRLVLPGLSARVPGEAAPFFRSARIELALPWSTLRGKSSDISSVVLKSPDLDAAGLRRWIATLPPRTTPLKLPTFTRGLQVDDGVVRGTTWRLEHIQLALPSLADGKPSNLEAGGDFVRGTSVSRFRMTLASTAAGMGRGLRIDDARIALRSDGELPSLTAIGSMHSADSFAVDLRGALQRIPSHWAAMIDSAYSRQGETPFAVAAGDELASSDPPNVLPLAPVRRHLRLRVVVGDPKRQPALSLDGEADRDDLLAAKLHGQLSRWPDAWPALPAALSSGTAALVFDASYRGSVLLEAPVVFDVRRADASLQGSVRVADLRGWLHDEHAMLPPVEATLSLPQIDAGGVQLRGVRLQIRDDDVPPKPAESAPKL